MFHGVHGVQLQLPLLKDVPAEHRPLQCVQRAGDAMYLPNNWKHGTLNIGEVSLHATCTATHCQYCVA
jgi:oxalate decarboxylase/phosphoglucose isomerase-like protein (cupin superfamily)